MQRKSHLNLTLRDTHETSWWKDPPDFLTQEQASLGLMAHAHCTRPGQVQGLGLKPGMMGFYITQGQGSILTARKRGWGKVIFSQAWVIPFVHGGWGGGVGFPACITDHMTREGGRHPGRLCIWEGSASRGWAEILRDMVNEWYTSYWKVFLFSILSVPVPVPLSCSVNKPLWMRYMTSVTSL